MFLRRIGRKTKIMNRLNELFPSSDIYIEPFFCAGGAFFAKNYVSQYNILNDLDAEVFNLWNVTVNKPAEFREMLEITPYDANLFKYYKTVRYDDDVKRAVRFLYLSNYGYLGKPNNISLMPNNAKSCALDMFNKAWEILKRADVIFYNKDYRDFLKDIHIKSDRDYKRIFIYCDPPYIDTDNMYKELSRQKWKENDFDTLLETLAVWGKKGAKYAVSEYDSPKVRDAAEKYGLNINFVCERQTLKNRNVEILLTNYDSINKLLGF